MLIKLSIIVFEHLLDQSEVSLEVLFSFVVGVVFLKVILHRTGACSRMTHRTDVVDICCPLTAPKFMSVA